MLTRLPLLAALRDLQAGGAGGLPGGVRRPRRLLAAVAPGLLCVLPLRRAARRPHLLLEERGGLVRPPLLREPAPALRRLRRDHLLRGLPAGRRAGLAQEALCLPGVRDAADGQTLRPGQHQPPVHNLQQEQAALSGTGVADKHMRRGKLNKNNTLEPGYSLASS